MGLKSSSLRILRTHPLSIIALRTTLFQKLILCHKLCKFVYSPKIKHVCRLPSTSICVELKLEPFCRSKTRCTRFSCAHHSWFVAPAACVFRLRTLSSSWKFFLESRASRSGCDNTALWTYKSVRSSCISQAAESTSSVIRLSVSFQSSSVVVVVECLFEQFA